jgi:hypothetical protein
LKNRSIPELHWGIEAAQAGTMNWLKDRGRAIEFAVAGWLTLLLAVAHFTVLTHAGALWRDEISSVRLAAMPTLDSFWSSLVFDPCPAFYFLLLRTWSALGLAGTDFNLRVLGCLTGIALIAALWLACWRINRSAPLWPLALFALNPVTFQFGDSLRAYGVAVICVVLSFASVWTLTFRPLSRRAVLLAFVTAIVTVQTLFTNSLIFFAICVAGLSVCAGRKCWQRAALILAVGAAAAASLLIYIPIFRSTREWSVLCVEATSYGTILRSYADALSEGSAFALYFWIGLVAIGLIAAAFTHVWKRCAEQDRQCQILFGAIALVVATVTTIVFFRKVGWPTSPWYFLPLMAVSVMSLHAITSALIKLKSKIFAPIAAAILSLLMVPSITQHALTRRTNADLIAVAVAQKATKEDLVLVSPYFYAVSFQRYYHGAAPWTALPSVDDYSLHRWDLLKRAMETPSAVDKTLARAQATLDAGHTVYLVGGFPPRAAAPPIALAPAPNSPSGWSFQAYVRNWGQQTSYVVHQHATRATFYFLKENAPISSLEHLRVLAVDGRVPSIATAN